MKLSEVNVAGVLKVEKVGPIFRIVDPHANKDAVPTITKRSTPEEDEISQDSKRRKGDLYADDTGPYWHKMSNPMITPPLFGENLPLQFAGLPVTGAPRRASELSEYERSRVRAFVGADLDAAELDELEAYCSPDNLKTGQEIKMATRVPVAGLISKDLVKDAAAEPGLCVLRALRARQRADGGSGYPRCLKYRGVKQLPPRPPEERGEDALRPGRDVLYRVRVYKPCSPLQPGDKNVRGRPSLFSCDLLLAGSEPLTALRDRLACRNDLGLRADRSAAPTAAAAGSARALFPSGFMFIADVFYVDGRAGCRDTAAAVRRWARARGLGAFPARRMEDAVLGRIPVKLAHPAVYVHQGACEHLFLFSELRLAGRRDPPHPRPCALSQNQTIYCTTCAEFGASWLVTGSARVPFDPAFFCRVCFAQYLYVDGRKTGDFRAYAYRGNELRLAGDGAALSYL